MFTTFVSVTKHEMGTVGNMFRICLITWISSYGALACVASKLAQVVAKPLSIIYRNMLPLLSAYFPKMFHLCSETMFTYSLIEREGNYPGVFIFISGYLLYRNTLQLAKSSETFDQHQKCSEIVPYNATWVERMTEERLPKIVLSRSIGGTKRRGRPRTRWKSEIERVIEVVNIRNWRRKALNKNEWWRIVHQAMGLLGSQS